MRTIATRLAALKAAGSGMAAGLCLVAPALALGTSPVAQDESNDGQDSGTADPVAAPIVLRAAKVAVRPGLELENAVVVVRDGRIAEVGADVEVPQGAEVLEGAVLTAGFIDAWSALGLDAATIGDASASPMTRTADAIDPFAADHLRSEALRAGITSFRAQAGLGSMVSGQGAVVRNSPTLDLTDSILLDDAVVQVGVPSGDVFQRLDAIEKLFSAIDSGAKYADSIADYERELAEWEEAIAEQEEELEKDFKKAQKKRDEEIEEAEEEDKEFKEKRYKEDRKPSKPRLDRDAAVLARVADGELGVVFQVSESPELRYFLERLPEFPRLRPILAGGNDAAQFANRLADARVPVLLQPDTANGDDELGLGLAAALSESGVEVLFGSGGRNPRVAADLPLLAALAVGHGLSREDALAALTTVPAQTLDVDRRVGSVVRGKDADLLLWSGDPFESTSRLLAVIAGGELVPLE